MNRSVVDRRRHRCFGDVRCCLYIFAWPGRSIIPESPSHGHPVYFFQDQFNMGLSASMSGMYVYKL